jgi:uncharacterized protein YbjT (DUF2867 family)
MNARRGLAAHDRGGIAMFNEAGVRRARALRGALSLAAALLAVPLLFAASSLASAQAPVPSLAVADLVGPQALLALRGKTVLVAGATGRNGRVVLRQLAQLGVRARGMTRDVADARRQIGAHYDWVEADVTRPQTLAAAVEGVDLVISAVATSMPVGGNRPERVDYEGTVNLARAAKAAGVTRFVIITSSSSGQKKHFLNYIGGNVLIWKKRAEEALMSSGLEYVIVGPAAIDDSPGGTRPIRIFPRDKYQRGMVINRDDLATTVIAAAALPAAANRVFSVANGTGAAVTDWSRTLGVMPRQ